MWTSSFGQLPDPLPSKQSLWDRPGVEIHCISVEGSHTNAYQRASFQAAAAHHWCCSGVGSSKENGKVF